MSDNLLMRGLQDRIRINVNEPWELHDWSEKLGVTADRLRAAVGAVGPMVADVRRYLGK